MLRIRLATIAVLMSCSAASGQEIVSTPKAAVGGLSTTAIAASPDGSQLAVATENSVVRVLDSSTFEVVQLLATGGRQWTAVAWSPDGSELATAGNIAFSGGAVVQWDLATGEVVRELAFEGIGTDVCYSADGTVLAASGWISNDGRLGVWDAASGSELLAQPFDRYASEVACAPDGSSVAVGLDTTTPDLYVYDPVSGSELLAIDSEDYRFHGLAYTPDGTRLVSGTGDSQSRYGKLRVWDSTTGALLLEPFISNELVESLAMAPSGSWVAVGLDERGVGAFDLTTGAPLWAAQSPEPTGYEVTQVTSLAITQADAVLAVEAFESPTNPTKRLELFSSLDGPEASPDLVLAGHTDQVTCAAWSADGSTLVTGSLDDTAIIWDASTGAALHTLTGHSGDVKSVAVSGDGSTVITGSDDGTAIVWNAGTGAQLHVLSGHASAVRSVAFSPDGTQVATGSLDTHLILWDVASGGVEHDIDHSAAVIYLRYSPDGSEIAARAAINLVFWNPSTGAQIDSLSISGPFAWGPGSDQLLVGQYDRAVLIERAGGAEITSYATTQVTSVAYAGDGSRLLLGTSHRTAHLWSPFERGLVQAYDQVLDVGAVALAPDGSRALVAARNAALVYPTDRGELRTASSWRTPQRPSSGSTRVALSPDHRYVLISDDNLAQIRSADNDQVLQTFDMGERVLDLAYSPTGTVVLVGGFNGAAKLFSATTGELLHDLVGHTDGVSAIAFSPDGAIAATGSWDWTVILWDVSTGAALGTPLSHSSLVTNVAFSPDGSQVATTANNSTITVWDTATTSFMLDLTESSNEGVAFSPDGSRLYTGGYSGYVRKIIEWDLASETQLRQWPLTFSTFVMAPDGQHAVISPSLAHGEVQLWDLDSSSLVRSFQSLYWTADDLALSEDGTVLVSAEFSSGDPQAVVWNTGLEPLTRNPQPIALGAQVDGLGHHLAYTDYVLTLADGDANNLVVRLTPASGGGSWRLLARHDQLPTLSAWDWSGAERPDGSLEMLIPDPPAGAIYLAAFYTDWNGAGAGSFTLTVEATDRHLSSVSPARGGTAGTVTATLRGLGFVPGMQVALRNGASTLRTYTANTQSSEVVTAAIALPGLSPQVADVVAIWPDAGERALANVFEIVAGGAGQVEAELELPEQVRGDRATSAALVYRNVGLVDATAPLITIDISPPTETRLDARTSWSASQISVLAINTTDEGPASVLPPGNEYRIPIHYLPTAPNHTVLQWDLRVRRNSDQSIDWDAQADSFEPQPADVAPEVWDLVWPLFTAEVGASWSDYYQTLLTVSDHLADLGRRVYDPSKLLAAVLIQVLGPHPLPSLTAGMDAFCPTPGIDLAFAREAPNDVRDRLRLGPFGYGWTHIWDISLDERSDGVVLVRLGGGPVRSFRPANGGYLRDPGDSGTLIPSGGGHTLIERNGARLNFTSNGRLSSVEDLTGNQLHFTYDQDRLIAIEHTNGDRLDLQYNAFGRISQLTDHAGRDTFYDYDPSGHYLLSVTAPGDVVTGYAYNTSEGSIISHALTGVTWSGGTHTTYSYDGHGRLVGLDHDGGAEPIGWSFDTFGEIETSTASGPVGHLLWDEYGRFAAAVDADGNRSLTLHSDDGWPVCTIGPEGETTIAEYGTLGMIRSLTDPTGGKRTTTVTYPASGGGFLSTVTDRSGHTLTIERDTNGLQSALVSPDLAREEYIWSVSGTLEQITTHSGHLIEPEVNTRGQITSLEVDGSPVQSATFDAVGRVDTITVGTETHELSYDARGHLDRIDYPNGRWVELGTDDRGRLTSHTRDDGFVVTYGYDSAGRMSTVTASGLGVLMTYHYDADGRLAREDRGNGTATTYDYDAQGRLVTVTHCTAADEVEESFTYAYDTNSRPVSVASSAGVTSYEYDSLGRLVKVTYPDRSTTTYAYDGEGNRTQVDDGTATHYTANSLHQYTDVGASTLTWDDDGNLSAVSGPPGPLSATWDPLGRLTSLDRGGSLRTYDYAPAGHLGTIVHDGQTRQLFTDPTGQTAVYDGSATLTSRYVWALGPVVRIDDDGSITYFGFDAGGNTRLLTDDTGTVSGTREYTPFGALRSTSGSATDPHGFLGRFGAFTDSHGWVLTGVRWYDPQLGRFVSPEPVRLLTGPNPYQYASNSPVARIDPSGLFQLGNHLNNAGAAVAAPMGKASGLTELLGNLGGAVTGLISYFDGAAKLVGVGNPESFLGSQWYYGANAANGLGSFLMGGEGLYSAAIGEKAVFAAIEVGGVSLSTIAIPVAVIILVDEVGTDMYIEQLRPDGADRFREPVPRNPWHTLNTAFHGHPPDDLVADYKKKYVNPEILRSGDPNEKTGPLGVGSHHVIPPDTTLQYTVYFENMASASAPAVEVFVSDQLDAELDWSTLRFTEIAWGDQVLPITTGEQAFATRVTIPDYRSDVVTSWWLDLFAEVDPGGEITWTFRTLDPATGDLPVDPLAGFLPPNDSTGRGEGHVSFAIDQLPELPSRTTLTNSATIVFDLNQAITTNTWSNTISWGACDPNLDGWMDAGDVMLMTRVLSDSAYVPPGNADCTEGGGETVDDLLWMLGVMF